MHLLTLEAASEWREWFQNHHENENEVWLVFFKRAIGQPSLDYEAVVEEALCFGWTDRLIKRRDEGRIADKFTPRNAESKRSQLNKGSVWG